MTYQLDFAQSKAISETYPSATVRGRRKMLVFAIIPGAIAWATLIVIARQLLSLI